MSNNTWTTETFYNRGTEFEVKVDRTYNRFVVNGNHFELGMPMKQSYDDLSHVYYEIIDFDGETVMGTLYKWSNDKLWTAGVDELEGGITRENEDRLDAAIQYVIAVF